MPISGDAGRGSQGPANLKPKNPTHLPDWGLILGSAAPSMAAKRKLIRFPPLLLTQSLPRKRFFGPALLAGFHVEAVLLYFLDDVFLLHFALKAAQCIFQRFTLLDNYFCQFKVTPNPVRIGFWRRPVTAPSGDYCLTRPLASSNQLQAVKSRNLSDLANYLPRNPPR